MVSLSWSAWARRVRGRALQGALGSCPQCLSPAFRPEVETRGWRRPAQGSQVAEPRSPLLAQATGECVSVPTSTCSGGPAAQPRRQGPAVVKPRVGAGVSSQGPPWARGWWAGAVPGLGQLSKAPPVGGRWGRVDGVSVASVRPRWRLTCVSAQLHACTGARTDV